MKKTQLQGMRKNLSAKPKNIFLLLALLCLSIGSGQVQAQSSCLTNSLVINTGINPNTLDTLTYHQKDPKWNVTGLSTYCAGLASIQGNTVTYPAYVIEPIGIWSTNPASSWIGFYDTIGGGYETVHGKPVDFYTMTLTRCFNMCSDDQIKLDLNIADDNFISNMNIDNGASIFSQYVDSINDHDHPFQTFDTLIPLSQGQHCINITVVNFPQTEFNPHGLNIFGTVASSTGTNSIVSESSECAKYVCPSPSSSCSDSCYWKVYGNAIINGNNKFGTLTKDDINIVTSSVPRGVITKDGLFGLYGQNPVNPPTAYLDVECLNHNPDGSGLSDVRFRDLEHFQEGNVVIIDPVTGYIFNSGIPIQSFEGAMGQITQLQNNNSILLSQISELKSKIDNLTSNPGTGIQNSALTNMLYQNTPNPFTKETSIGYYIVQINGSASIMLSDMNGRKLTEYPISQPGKGSTVVTTGNMLPGMYLYTLIVDGVAIDTKKMIISSGQ